MENSLKNLLQIYLNDSTLLKGELEMRAQKVASELCGSPLLLHDVRLDHLVRTFQTQCLPYWTGLGITSPSHLKVLGHLLYSLTQVRDTEDQRVRCFAIEPDLAATLSDENKRLGAFFHEFCCYTVVHTMLCSAQRRRRAKLVFEPQKPPTNPRFTRSMISYLRDWRGGPLTNDKSPYDFYMIFKTMDLYGLQENVDR